MGLGSAVPRGIQRDFLGADAEPDIVLGGEAVGCNADGPAVPVDGADRPRPGDASRKDVGVSGERRDKWARGPVKDVGRDRKSVV